MGYQSRQIKWEMKGEEEKEAGGTQEAASHGVVAPWWHTTCPVPPSCASCPLRAAGPSPRCQPAWFCPQIGSQICPKIPELQEGTWVPVGPHGCSAPCPASPSPVRAPLAPGRDPGPGGAMGGHPGFSFTQGAGHGVGTSQNIILAPASRGAVLSAAQMMLYSSALSRMYDLNF